jgi:hypothetical protein
MAAIDTYDAVVLGSGEAGKSIAWHLGGTGKGVAVGHAWGIRDI